MPDAVFLDYGSTSRDDLNLSRLQATCGHLQLWPQTRPDELLQHIGNAAVIISNKVVLDAAVLEALQHQIRLVCIAATGTNNVDLAAAKRLGIPVTNVRDYASQSVAEHTIALLFSLARQIPAYREALQRGDWQRSPHFCLLDYPMVELAGKTFGIVGHGVLGQATARLAEALGMRVMIADHPGVSATRPGRVSFETLLATADVVSLHCPLNEQTRNLINAECLQQMKPSAFLLNTGRGGLVNEADLLAALRSGEIAGAALDVLKQEPPAADCLLLQESLPNLIISPHIAWASQRARQTLLDQLATIIASWQQGTLLNAVT